MVYSGDWYDSQFEFEVDLLQKCSFCCFVQPNSQKTKGKAVKITGFQLGFHDQKNGSKNTQGKGDIITFWIQYVCSRVLYLNSHDHCCVCLRKVKTEPNQTWFFTSTPKIEPKPRKKNWTKIFEYTRTTNQNFGKNFKNFEEIKFLKNVIVDRDTTVFLALHSENETSYIGVSHEIFVSINLT